MDPPFLTIGDNSITTTARCNWVAPDRGAAGTSMGMLAVVGSTIGERLRWRINDIDPGPAHGLTLWEPRPGSHTVALVDADAHDLDVRDGRSARRAATLTTTTLETRRGWQLAPGVGAPTRLLPERSRAFRMVQSNSRQGSVTSSSTKPELVPVMSTMSVTTSALLRAGPRRNGRREDDASAGPGPRSGSGARARSAAICLRWRAR